jgi:hypothetical protein
MGTLVDPLTCFPSHPSEEVLEEYLFHRPPEALIAQVEEHLLVCHSCQDALEETERFVSDLKVAARHPVADVAPAGPSWRLLRPSAWAAAVLAVTVLAFLAVWQHSVAPPAQAEVSLSSLRGLEPLSQAPAGELLHLNLEALDLTTGKQYRVEVVDAAGGPIWQGAVTAINGKLVATLSKPLRHGVYWVRLYDADSELLREFGMSAR